MNEIMEKEIENKIYTIRGVEVMLDSDLAELFNVETGNLNKAMKRNIERFPKEFCFRLTSDEYKALHFQNGIAKKKGGRTNLPYVYSEQGVAMISSILHSNVAIRMSIMIINAFVKMRHYLMNNGDIYKSITNINNKLTIHDEKFDYLFSKFDRKEQLFLKDETYTAYKSILDIITTANNEIIVVDAYADITFLDLIKTIHCKKNLITKDSKRLSNTEIDKYNNEFHNLEVIRNNSFHDRYIIIDQKDIYLCGSSINNIGSKTTMIIKLEDKKNKEVILQSIYEII